MIDERNEFTLTTLKVALLGVKGIGSHYLEALQSDERYDVVAVAVADKDMKRLQSLSLPSEVKLYEDYRSLVVECGRASLDVLVVALPAFQSHEYVKLAASMGCHMLHLSPAGRNADELAQSINLTLEHSGSLSMSQFWMHEKRYKHLRKARAKLGRIDSAAMIIESTSKRHKWLGDLSRAGGGALLHGAYAELFIMIDMLGCPESVFAECSFAGASAASRNYDTEDAANLMIRFPGSTVVSLLVRRSLSCDRRLISLYGENDSLSIQLGPGWSRRAPVKPNDGLHPWQQAINDEVSAYAEALAAQTLAVVFPVDQHITTLATIDAAYLSARTGQAEAPSRFLVDELV